MSRPLRYQPHQWSTLFITGRCIHSRFLLRPSPQVNSLINGILERGSQAYSVRLHAMCFMSNHYHLLLSSRDASSTSSFMQFILSNIAREIGRIHNWQEKFWGRRYRATLVLDDAAQIDRLKCLRQVSKHLLAPLPETLKHLPFRFGCLMHSFRWCINFR